MEDLKLLIRSRYPILYVETYEEERMEDLLAAVAADLGLPFWTWSVTRGLHRRGTEQPVYDTTQPLALLRHLGALHSPGVYLLRDFHPFFSDPTVVRHLREYAQRDAHPGTVVLCSPALDLPVELRKLAARYALELPDEAELRRIVVATFRQLDGTRKLRYELDETSLRQLAHNLRGLTASEARRIVARCAFDDLALTPGDVACVLEGKREQLARGSLLEFVAVDQEQPGLGGLGNLKRWLERAHAGFGARAKTLGIQPPRGVLLVGVQGCGKSLAAKTIARLWQLPLLRLEPGRLFDKYVGESEKNLRQVLESAEAIAPAVLWIDEIEKVFAAGGSSEADAGLGRRLFGSFLTWLQERKAPVFVAATANDLSALPPELLRKGRFDEIFFVDLPDAAARAEILTVHLRARRQDPGAFDLARLVEASDGFSGAEIEQAVVAAIYGMLAEGAADLGTERLLEEIERTSPLSWTHREQIEALRTHARDRFVFAN